MTDPVSGPVGMPYADAYGRAKPAHRSLDEDLSSTAPDVARTRSLLSIPATLGWGAGLGAGIGALLMRSPGGWNAGALAARAFTGAVAGAALGTTLVGIDRVTDGGVQRRLDYLSLERRSQIWFVLSHPTDPWLARTGLDVARDAKATQRELYGAWDPKDGAPDALRHTYAAALFTLRAIRDHDESPADARALAIGAGEAHEADGQDNNDAASRSMDSTNNHSGAAIAGDGRALPGEAADPRGFLTEDALRLRVLAAMAAGELVVVERGDEAITTRATSSADLPYPGPRA